MDNQPRSGKIVSFEMVICGVAELPATLAQRFSHLISIWDKGASEASETEEFVRLCHPGIRVLRIHFDDPLGNRSRPVPATRGDIRKVLEFARTCGVSVTRSAPCEEGM